MCSYEERRSACVGRRLACLLPRVIGRQIAYLLSPYLLPYTKLHLWLDAVDCRPDLTPVAKKLSGLGGLSLSG